MSVTFGAAAVTIDRGDHMQKFNLKRSIPLREPVLDEDGTTVLRQVEETDDVGKKLYTAVKADLALLQPAIKAIPEDKVELRISREAHPDDPTNPEMDTVSIRFCPNGEWQRNNPSYHGITEEGFPNHTAAQLFGLLRRYAISPRNN